MPRVLKLLVSVMASVSVLPAADAAVQHDRNKPIEVGSGRGGSAIEHSLEGGGETSSAPGSSSGRRRTAGSAAPPPRRFYAGIPNVVPDGAGGYCIAVERIPYNTEREASQKEQSEEQRWLGLAKSYGRCPDPATPPQTSPAAMATEYWKQVGEDRLPKPKPHIAPGYMLAGKMAYLEGNTTMADRFGHATPLGPLTIDAKGQLFVDWGDGTGLQGPFDNQGGPWPNGTITHYWTTAGRYDIVVTQRWTATWHLGGSSGELSDLATVGRIEDFEVRQLQAVRNR